MQQGIDLMVFGMGTVFVFLTLLVIATAFMSAMVNRYLPAPEPLPARQPQKQKVSADLFPSERPTAVDSKTLAVIKAAIEQHRSKHQ